MFQWRNKLHGELGPQFVAVCKKWGREEGSVTKRKEDSCKIEFVFFALTSSLVVG
jgi:hypothetical protein